MTKIMTNEEKAREIVDKELNTPITLANRHQAEFSLEGHCEKVALEMAEWKDKQFKEYLTKFIFQCEMTAKTVLAYDLDAAGRNEMYAECAKIIINELFKED